MLIKVVHDPAPAGSRQWDYTAFDDDSYDGPGSPIGTGETAIQAVKDLIEQLEDRDDSYDDTTRND